LGGGVRREPYSKPTKRKPTAPVRVGEKAGETEQRLKRGTEEKRGGRPLGKVLTGSSKERQNGKEGEEEGKERRAEEKK